MVARGCERERNAVHQRHLDVGQQQVEAAAFAHDDVERVGTVHCGDDLMAGIDEGTRRQGA